MGLILPVALLGAGAGGGVAAGLALSADAADGPMEASAEGPTQAPTEGAALACAVGPDGALVALGAGGAGAAGSAGAHGAGADAGLAAHGASGDHGAPTGGHPATGAGEGGHDYVRLANQFVVPLLDRGAVAGLVLVSLSVEVPEGEEEALRHVEPKLRDAVLATLFDHANAGGFGGDFTSSETLATLRRGLRAAADRATGGLASDVLIVEMVRQDG